MSLVIPQSNQTFQPVRQGRADPNAENIGTAVERVASVGLNNALQDVQQQRAAEVRGARITAMEQLAQLRNSYAEDTDFATIEQRFARDADAVAQGIKDTLPADAHRDFDLEFRSMAIPHVNAINTRSRTVRRDYFRADMQGGLDRIAQLAAGSDDEGTRAEYLGQGAALIGAAMEAGTIGRQEGQRLIEGLAKETEQATAIRLLRENPAELVIRLDNGQLRTLAPTDRERWKTRAASELNAQAARDRAVAGKLEKEALAQLTAQVDAAEEIMKDGRPYADRAALEDAVSGIPELERRMAGAAQHYELLSEFAVMSPSQQDALIEQYRKVPASNQHGVSLETLQKINEDTEKAAASRTKEEIAAIGDRVDDAVKIIEGGRQYAGLAELVNQARGTEHFAKLQGVLETAEAARELEKLPPSAQGAARDMVAGIPTANPDSVPLAEMDAIREKTVKAIASDPIQYLIDRQLTDVQPIDFADKAGVEKRIAQAEQVEHAPGATPRYLSNAERDALAARIAEASPQDQLVMATSVIDNFGKRAPRVFGELGLQAETFAVAGQLAYLTGDGAAARMMLQGQKLMETNDHAKISGAVRGGVRMFVGSAIPEVASARDRIGQIMRAADAHFAAAMPLDDPDASTEEKREAYMKSVHAVTGGTIDRRGRMLGGFQRVNDRWTMLPPGVSSDHVEDAISAASDVATWAAAAVDPTGAPAGAPMFSRRKGRQRVRTGNLELVSIGGGLHLVATRLQSGRREYITGEGWPDGYARIDLRKLMKATGVAP